MENKRAKRVSPALRTIYPILILVICLIMGIGYATLNSIMLNISGESIAMLQEGVFITEVNYSTSNGADIVNSNINATTGTLLNSSIVLSSSDSTSYITYSIKLLNSYDFNAYYIGTKYDTNFYDNSNIVFELSNNLVQGMVLSPGESIEFTITFKYKNGVIPSQRINKLNSYISFVFSTIPSDYVVLEYIESTGTQYIDTGVSAANGFKFEGKASFTLIPGHTMGVIGAHDISEPYYRNYLTLTTETGTYSWCFSADNYYFSTLTNFESNVTYDIEMSTVQDNIYFYVDGVNQLTNFTQKTAVRTANNLYLMGINNGNGVSAYAYMKLYESKLYLGDELVRYFIPCINPSGEVGLYDLATNQFYGNSGTGEFVASLPKGYTLLNYIESTGTQYIDTGYKPTSENLKVELTFLSTNNSNGNQSLFGNEINNCELSSHHRQWSMVLYGGINSWTHWVGYTEAFHRLTTTINTIYTYSVHANNGSLSVVFNGSSSSSTYSGVLLKTLNIFIFANHIDGSVNQFSYIRLYSFKMYDSDILVRDFVPVTDASGTAGLYDLVNNKFYGNSGSGSFLTG